MSGWLVFLPVYSYLRFRELKSEERIVMCVFVHVCVCVGDRCLSFSWFYGRMTKGNLTNPLEDYNCQGLHFFFLG